MNKKAFTMIELVMVIVVLGILAALAIPRLNRDHRQEAADTLLANIRYAQHYALQDDKSKFDNQRWQRRFWHIYFGTCEGEKVFTVGSDDNMDGSANARVDFDESALDPANGKHLWAHDGGTCSGSHETTEISPSVFIGKKYGVKTISPSGGCSNNYIGFDHLGRPYGGAFPNSNQPDNDGLITQPCIFTFTLEKGDPIEIQIEPETGYAFVIHQEHI